MSPTSGRGYSNLRQAGGGATVMSFLYNSVGNYQLSLNGLKAQVRSRTDNCQQQIYDLNLNPELVRTLIAADLRCESLFRAKRMKGLGCDWQSVTPECGVVASQCGVCKARRCWCRTTHTEVAVRATPAAAAPAACSGAGLYSRADRAPSPGPPGWWTQMRSAPSCWSGNAPPASAEGTNNREAQTFNRKNKNHQSLAHSQSLIVSTWRQQIKIRVCCDQHRWNKGALWRFCKTTLGAEFTHTPVPATDLSGWWQWWRLNTCCSPECFWKYLTRWKQSWPCVCVCVLRQ